MPRTEKSTQKRAENRIKTLMERDFRMEVKIFLSISYGGMHKKKNKYGACVEYITPKGKVATRYYYGDAPDNTGYNQIMLVALVHAMRNLNKPCYITAYVKTEYIENMLNRGLPGQWEKNGWRNAKSELIACHEQWGELLRMINIHNLTFAKAYDNDYTKEMNTYLHESRRETENEGNCNS